ncbi:hypothetical protein H0H93_013701, partial [Arthromyces matolae]
LDVATETYLSMPPRKRRNSSAGGSSSKKRARKSKATDEDPNPPSGDLVPKARATISPDANKGLVFNLPSEIWLEILSYFSSLRIPTLRLNDSPLLPPATLQRGQALRALSQTCQGFRERFLGQCWERFEVCAMKIVEKEKKDGGEGHTEEEEEENGESVSGAWYKTISQALERKSHGLRQTPDIAKFVTTVSVALTRCDHKAVLSAFVQCLESLPNLHTLQVVRAHTQMTTHLKLAFEGHVLPQVRTVVLPDHAHNVLRSCPGVREVMCNYDDGGKLIGAIGALMKERGEKAKTKGKGKGKAKAKDKDMDENVDGVRVLSGFRVDLNMMKRIVKFVPELEEIRLSTDAESLALLTPLIHLRRIELHASPEKDPSESLPEPTKPGLFFSANNIDWVEERKKFQEVLGVAKGVLVDARKKRGGNEEEEEGKLWLRVRYERGRLGKGKVEEVRL